MCINLQISKQHKVHNLSMITLRNHALQSYVIITRDLKCP